MERRLRNQLAHWLSGGKAADQKFGDDSGGPGGGSSILPQYRRPHKAEHESDRRHRLDQRIELHIGKFPAFPEFLEPRADSPPSLQGTDLAQHLSEVGVQHGPRNGHF